MDLTAIQTLIGTVGFPIAASVGLFWYLSKEQKNHKEEMDALRQSLNDNTVVLSELKILIQNLKGGGADAS